MHGRKGNIPPCDECIPSLHPANEETVKVWSMAAQQHIMGPSGPVDINLAAVIGVMEVFGVVEKEFVMRRVKMLHNRFLKEDAEKRASE